MIGKKKGKDEKSTIALDTSTPLHTLTLERIGCWCSPEHKAADFAK